MLGAASYLLARLVAGEGVGSGAAVAVLFRNCRDARVRVLGTVANPNYRALGYIASDFLFLQGLDASQPGEGNT